MIKFCTLWFPRLGEHWRRWRVKVNRPRLNWPLKDQGSALVEGSSAPQVLSFPFALGLGGLKHAGRRHEVLDVLPQDLVLRLQLQVLLFHCIHTSGEI